MDQYSSSLVDTSLDLTIGVTRMRVEENSPLQTNALVDELNRVSAENKKLSEMLTLMCDNYNVLRKQLMEYVNKSNMTERDQISPPKKRKSPARDDAFSSAVIGGVSESSSTDQDEYLCKKQREETVVKEKVSRVYYKTEASDTTLVVKDGYQWRKYGQKVTRDNPSPRAYFKCACAPSCSVKKKVQRSVEDQSVLVATYEGEHNHPMPSQVDSNNGLNRYISLGGSAPTSAAANKRSNLTEPVSTLDLTESKKVTSSTSSVNFPEVQKLLVEQMASSLTKDPNFTAALAAAVTGRLYQQNQTQK